MDSDSETEGAQRPRFSKGAIGRVMLIDVRDPSATGAPRRALDAVLATVRSEIRSGGVRYTSVCLYNTTSGVRGVVEVLPLITPALEDYKKLLSADASKHGQANSSELADALWHCSRAFASCKRSLGEKSVVVLARFDDPPPQNQQRPALKRAVDLYNLGIEMCFINVSENEYECHPFYTDLMKASTNGRLGAEALPKPIWSVRDIELQLKCRSHHLASTARLKLNIGGNLNVGVGVYCLSSKKDPPRKVPLSKDRNELVTSNITTVRVAAEPSTDEPGPSAGETPREVPLLKSEILFYQDIGGKRIEFKWPELTSMKMVFGPPNIQVLGFKPQILLAKEKYYIRSCQFLFPDERSIEGSTRAFRALWKACDEKKVVAICMMRVRLTSHPRIVALWPCSTPLGLSVDLGFDIIHLPFLENKKDVPDPEQDISAANYPAEVELMKDIVKKLKFDYTPDTFENPQLQCLYRAIEALALEEETVEPIVDTTKPKSNKFEQIDSELFEDTFGPFNVAVAKKRPAASGSTQSTAPKRKVMEDIDEDLLNSRLEIREVHKYNVKDLKDILYWKNPPGLKALTGLKKDELVKLVYENFKK